MRKKFLIVGDFLTGSGLTGVIFNIFPKITANYDVTAVGYGQEESSEIAKKCKELRWNLIRTPSVNKNPIKHWLFWYRFFYKFKFDYIYFNYSSAWNFLPVYFAHKYTHAKIIIHSHNTYYSHIFSNKLLMNILNRVNNLGKKKMNKLANYKVATSIEAAKWMFGKNISPNDVLISRNGINIEKYQFNSLYRSQIREKYNINDQTTLFGFVGVLQERKNPIFAIKVFSSIIKLHPDSKLVLIGKGELEKEVNDEINKLNLKDKVILIPYTNVVNKWYSAMDVLLFPSKYEGLPLTLIEAQVADLYIFASDRLPKDVYVTERIQGLSIKNIDIWIDEIKKVSYKNINQRNMPNTKLLKYSDYVQAQKIKQYIS